MNLHLDDYRIPPGKKIALKKVASRDDGGLSKDQGLAHLEKLHARLIALQELLYGENRHALLVVFQAMDTGGKDGAIRQVFAGCSPASVVVTSFKGPTEAELAHDFLWRVHQCAPRKGVVGVFNRSHYEDVLIARVKNLVPEDRWRKRYDHINHFEKLLHDEDTTVLKFFLHISKDYQKERLERRLDQPEKNWKFDPADLTERQRWDQYLAAYEDALALCSKEHAPWYIIPAEHHWYRDLLITAVLVETLEGLKMHYPAPKMDVSKIKVE